MNTIQVMYMGERVVQYRTIIQLFQSRDGKEHWFSKVKHPWFGTVYEMNADGTMAVRPKSVETDWEPTKLERSQWEAAKIVVASFRQEQRKTMKLKRPHDDITKAVNLLRPFYKPLTNIDRRRFIDWVANECSRKSKKT